MASPTMYHRQHLSLLPFTAQELMPKEGLNRQQRQQLAAFEYARKAAEKEKEAAGAQMQAVLTGDMSWGMREDAEGMDPGDVDWRGYATTNSLNDRQQKLAENVGGRG